MTIEQGRKRRIGYKVALCFLAVVIFVVGVCAGKELQEILQEKAAEEAALQAYIEALESDSYQLNKYIVDAAYNNTILINEQDREVIASSTMDFSDMKITCLGDSITAGIEDEIPYTNYLQEILGAKEVVNAGVGGSTITTTDGAYPMVERIEEIPEDTDLLIVLGGINDNFYQPCWLFGNLYSQEREVGTFCGDLELLMEKCKLYYPNMEVIFFTPMANQLVTDLQADNPYILSQEPYIDAFTYIGNEQGYGVVNLYSMNFLNSNNEDIQSTYMMDQTHLNSAGGKLLAERMASEIIVRYEESLGNGSE